MQLSLINQPFPPLLKGGQGGFRPRKVHHSQAKGLEAHDIVHDCNQQSIAIGKADITPDEKLFQNNLNNLRRGFDDSLGWKYEILDFPLFHLLKPC